MMIVKKRGQVLLELLWVILFVFGFLSSFGYFYDQSQKKIEKHRMGKVVKNGQSNILTY